MDATEVIERARAWLEVDDDPETRAELEGLLEGDAELLAERFAGRLEFGTAGLRGLLGTGPTRMNRVVVRQTSAGLADYLLEKVPDAADRGVVIGYDGRKSSDVFAVAAARMFLDRGLPVFLSDGPCPTPLAAFAVKDLAAAGGVVITASHNPPDYNGYKVFWENGAQIIPPHDAGIAAAIEAAVIDPAAPEIDIDAAAHEGRLRRFGEDNERRYRRAARGLMCNADIASSEPISIAYTPLHGVGAGPVVRLLSEAGFSDVAVEPSQAEPDGAFPTVAFPNPEEPGATDRLLALAASRNAELAIANDPDADRLSVAIPSGDGYRQLSGDEVGVLLADYLLAEGDPRGRRLVMTTVVSSQLLEAMAAARGVEYREVLTGFKWIANGAIEARARGERLVLGYEEALGYGIGEVVYDKDGISAALIFAELMAVAKSRGETVTGRLERIYRDHGVFATRQVSLTRPGAAGLEEIAAAMKRFRDNPPAEIGGRRLRKAMDLAEGGELPPADVLIYRLADGSRVIMRPSGTEPKLKCYYETREELGDNESVDDALARAQAALDDLAEKHQAMLAGG
jgi:phosphomannomutase